MQPGAMYARYSVNLGHLLHLQNEAANSPPSQGCVCMKADNKRRMLSTQDPLGHINPVG